MLCPNLCPLHRSATFTLYSKNYQKDGKLVFKTNYHLMQVKSISECSKGEHSAILLTFIKLSFVIKIFVLSIFEGLFYTGFTVVPTCASFGETSPEALRCVLEQDTLSPLRTGLTPKDPSQHYCNFILLGRKESK